jgi:uncharacterized BrkB/YihY/UPF0761 family membrane protein
LSILGSVTSDETTRSSVVRFVLRYFPQQFEFITVQLEAFRRAPVASGLAGSAVMIWAAVGVFGAITSAVNHAWSVEEQRSY